MSFSDAEEQRIEAIEELLNKVQIAINNLMSKQQMRQLLLAKEEELTALKNRVTALEEQVTVLQGSL